MCAPVWRCGLGAVGSEGGAGGGVRGEEGRSIALRRGGPSGGGGRGPRLDPHHGQLLVQVRDAVLSREQLENEWAGKSCDSHVIQGCPYPLRTSCLSS